MANTCRIVPGPNQDNTGRQLTRDFQSPAYASTLTLTTTQEKTLVKVGQLTGTQTINIGVGSATTAPFVGDEITFLFSADSTAGGHVVTFGTGTASTGTLTVAASKYGKATAIFDGTEWIVTSNATA